MPYCPNCRAEFRAGFEVCKSCGDVPLVDVLPETLELPEEELEDTVPVGLMSSRELGQVIEVGGRQVDVSRVVTIKTAHEYLRILLAARIRCAMVPVGELDFPDGQPRVEVRVKTADGERAEATLRDAWKAHVEREGTAADASETAIDACPACGASVPLDAEECPDCGLFVGAAGDDDEDEEDDGEEE